MKSAVPIVLWSLFFGLQVACAPHPVYRSDGKPVAARIDQGPRKTSRAISQPKEPPPVVKPAQPAHPLDPEGISTENAYQVGVASFYGKPFHGRKTANGEVFNMYKMTAAHRVLPLGTIIKVTHLVNGRWVVVKVNDRGPFVQGRVLDLSFAAALELEMADAGLAEVMIEIVEPVE